MTTRTIAVAAFIIAVVILIVILFGEDDADAARYWGDLAAAYLGD